MEKDFSTKEDVLAKKFGSAMLIDVGKTISANGAMRNDPPRDHT